MVGLSLAPFVLRRPWLAKMLTPAANWYANAAGYRKLGLKYDAPPPHRPPIFAKPPGINWKGYSG